MINKPIGYMCGKKANLLVNLMSTPVSWRTVTEANRRLHLKRIDPRIIYMDDVDGGGEDNNNNNK
jgi:hypothetical protein